MDRTVGNNVKRHRERLAWTQEHLAAAAALSARTVQRIEEGGPVSADSLLGLAAAFNVSVDDLRRTPEEEAKLEATAAEALKQVEERYTIARLARIERGSDLTSFFSGADASLCSRVDLKERCRGRHVR
jgi:transcriptional regulator with XRE-family HTH domain